MSDDEQGPRAQVSHTSVVAAPVERVWALVSDPALRPEWDTATATVTVDRDGVEHLGAEHGGPQVQVVLLREPGRAITWRRWSGDSVPGGPSRVLGIALLPEGDHHTQVHLHQSWPVPGLGVRLARPLLARMARAQLRTQALGILRALDDGGSDAADGAR